MQAHGFAQAPPDTVSRYRIAEALRCNKTTAAAWEVVRPDNESYGVRRPRFALAQDGSKVTLFLDLLRLVQSSRRACKTGVMLRRLSRSHCHLRGKSETCALNGKDEEGRAGSDGKLRALSFTPVLEYPSSRSRGHARPKAMSAQPAPHFRLICSFRHPVVSFFPLSDSNIAFR